MATSSTTAGSRRPSRFRWLAAVHILLCVTLALFVVGTFVLVLAVVVTGFGIGHWPLQVPVSGDVARPVHGLSPAVELTGRSQVTVIDATFGQTALWASGRLATLALAVGVLLPLLRATGYPAVHEPFNTANARRMRTVGLMLLFGSIIVAAVHTVTNWLIAVSVLGDNAGGPYPHIPWLQMFAGVAVLAVTELVRHGTALREELDEVV